jgi:hypothetical protein
MHVVMIHATFANKSDADHIYDQAMTVATNASVARLGEPGERTSHGGVFEEQPDGSLVPDRRWHIDRFGIVRDGQMVPDDVVPEWIQPTGAHDAYPATDVHGNPTRVMRNGKTWINQNDTNTQTPGVAGWQDEAGQAEQEQTGESYPAWKPWSGINDDLHQVGDRVTHNGSTWEATAGNNHWEPGVYGWVQL